MLCMAVYVRVSERPICMLSLHAADCAQFAPSTVIAIGCTEAFNFESCLSLICRLLTSTFLLAHLMAQDLIRQAPAMLMRVQSMPAAPSQPSKKPPDVPGGSSSAGYPLTGSLTGSALALVERQQFGAPADVCSKMCVLQHRQVPHSLKHFVHCLVGLLQNFEWPMLLLLPVESK